MSFCKCLNYFCRLYGSSSPAGNTKVVYSLSCDSFNVFFSVNSNYVNIIAFNIHFFILSISKSTWRTYTWMQIVYFKCVVWVQSTAHGTSSATQWRDRTQYIDVQTFTLPNRADINALLEQSNKFTWLRCNTSRNLLY